MGVPSRWPWPRSPQAAEGAVPKEFLTDRRVRGVRGPESREPSLPGRYGPHSGVDLEGTEVNKGRSDPAPELNSGQAGDRPVNKGSLVQPSGPDPLTQPGSGEPGPAGLPSVLEACGRGPRRDDGLARDGRVQNAAKLSGITPADRAGVQLSAPGVRLSPATHMESRALAPPGVRELSPPLPPRRLRLPLSHQAAPATLNVP